MKHLIAHYEDLDGLSCHVIAERTFPKLTTHHDITYANQAQPFLNIPHGNHILFCDLGYSKNTIPMLEEIKRHNANGSVVDFYDHHEWDPKILEEHFNRIHFDKQKSSGQLLQKDIAPNDTYSKYIAELAYNDDRSNFTKETQQLSDIIKSEYPFEQLIFDLANTTKVNPDAIKAMNTYRENKARAIETLQTTYETHDLNGIKIITGLADGMLYMKEGFRQMKRDNPQGVLFCFYKNTPAAIFEVNSDYFTKLTQHFTAGGRNNQGGIDFHETITNNNYQRIKEEVFNVLQ